jgi:hypothetical protein
MWKDGWRPEKNWCPGLPRKWWKSQHSSGHVVGEVDAGRYMVMRPDGLGMVDETGDYVAFSSADEAKRYVEDVVENSRQ